MEQLQLHDSNDLAVTMMLAKVPAEQRCLVIRELAKALVDPHAQPESPGHEEVPITL